MPVNVTPPSITGTPEVGTVLLCDPGEWTVVGALAVAFAWSRPDALVGAAASFTPAITEEGVALTCTITALDGTGSATMTVTTEPVRPARPRYATATALRRYMSATAGAAADGIPSDDSDAMRRLLRRAEGDVDAVLGSYPINAVGRKLDPLALEFAQRDALARATCAAAEHRLIVGEEALVGDDEFGPANLALLRPMKRPAPKITEELAGAGLLVWSGIAASDAQP